MNNDRECSNLYHPLLGVLADQISEALIVLNESFHVVIFNQHAESLLNYPASLAIGSLFDEVCSKSNIDCFISKDQLIQNRKDTMFEFSSLIHKLPIKWQLHTAIIHSQWFYLMKTMQLEEKYRNETYQLETLIENTPCNLYWVDKHSKMIGCNQNVLTMLNMTREEFRGKTYEELSMLCNWPEGLGDKLKQDDMMVMRTGIPIIGKEDPPMPHADGSCSNFLTSRVPLRNQEGDIVGIAGISMDITALKEARAKAQAANQAKTEFIANMSHDIRTPLSGIVGMSELLKESAKNPEQQQYAEWINQCGEQLLDLLNGILDVASADHVSEYDIHRETFDLKQCLNDLIRLERPSTTLKGLHLQLNVDEEVPQYLISDRTKLHRILLNLLGNAIKFTDQGSITIEVKLLALKKEQALIHFAVIDTGIGIPKDQQDKVFDRFHRVNPSYKGIYTGHGVGLHIAQAYTRLLGSEIQLTSELGVGTTFFFDLWLPFSSNKDFIQSSNSNHTKQEHGNVLNTHFTQATQASIPRLLLVEDNHIALKMLENYATKCNCQFLSISDAEQALQLVQSQEFDLVITDIGLPGMSGDELAREIRSLESHHKKHPMPVIGLTAHADGEIKASCLKAGMNEIFSKPINLNQMHAILNTYLSSKNSIPTEKSEVTADSYGKLGLDLPDTEEELFTLDKYPLLDVDSAIKSIGNEETMHDILQLMMSEEIQHDINHLKSAHEQKDWETIEKLAHKMKGGAVYIGTVKMKYACQYLERYYKAGHRKQLELLYQQLINVVYATQQYISNWLKN
ncbi:PAS domain-containing sensor histidine kinase [Legionella oakridgensis]|uniref:histidine kinase n=2 Tax=Legionella oakridgensis TaxID=29423 RepID=W0BFY1_9GAMM|nr:PAS domain-containing sensor histidine kinase [Legionella oakridgensis]AHE67611.1 PAS domain S-box [Legionella oakridgensis ATCC 33761 = DSM 21215]ETO92849.1 PAS domain S-box protein [Legionella oakridgensis RV-2-2007]KTD37044.1 sensory box histidine kinase/response regulator [Legionella oakridgensis]STY20647.1 sensory box histidine kinase/response regulator [Legionella longbeachae]